MRAGDSIGLRQRAYALTAIRSWFVAHGYLEVLTPTLVPSPAMEEHLFSVSAADGYLRTSPEFSLKKVAALSLPRIYEIGPCFRARESGPWHGREFYMLEWYRAGAHLSDLMDEVESLVSAVAGALDVTLPEPWRRTTVSTLFYEATGLELFTCSVADLSHDLSDSWDEAFFRRWLEDVEPRLTGPTFVSDWPASQAALAQIRGDGASAVAQRFEVFFGGIELANAFYELIDSDELAARFMRENSARQGAGESPHPVDWDLIEAVGQMPSTSGIALGIDRLVAALLGWDGIESGRVQVNFGGQRGA